LKPAAASFDRDAPPEQVKDIVLPPREHDCFAPVMRRCCVVVRRGFANFDVCGDKTGTLQAAPPSRLRGREGRGLAFQNWADVSKLG
jgi:hypothetical protein